MSLKVFWCVCVISLSVTTALKEGRILTLDEIGEFGEFQTPLSQYQYVRPEGSVTPHTGVVGPRTTPERLLELLRDRYVRTPIAVVVDTAPTSLSNTKRLWEATLKNVEDETVDIVVMPYNASGLGPVFKTKGVPWFQQVLQAVPVASTLPLTSGVAFYSILKATEQIPFDSAIFLFTARQAVDEYLAQLTATTLMQKRCKLHVIWFNTSPSTGDPIGAYMLYREMTANTGGVFLVADTDITDVDVFTVPTRAPDQEMEILPHREVEVPDLDVEVPDLELEMPDREVETPYPETHVPKLHEVTVAVRQELTGTSTTPVYVDSTIHGVHVTIAGPITAAVLRQPSGLPIDLLSDMALRRWASGGAQVLHKSDALLELKLNTSAVAPGVWQLVTTGREHAGSYNVTVKAYSKLSFSASLLDVGTKDKMDGVSINGSTQLRLTMKGVGSIAQITLLDKQGKELGQLTYQRREGYETDPNDDFTTDLDMPKDIPTPSAVYVRLSGQDPSGAEFTRVSRVSFERQTQVASTSFEAVTIDVAANSSLYVQPGQRSVIIFQVTNNRNAAVLYTFNAYNDRNFVLTMNPRQAYIGPQLTYDVVVNIMTPQSVVQGTTNIVTLLVRGSFEQPVKKSALMTVSDKVWDVERPYVWHSLKINCRAFTEPNVCYNKVWNVEIHLEDRHSGLLYVKSSPRGIRFNPDWIAGTKTSVVGYYSASCCENKVAILAMDVNGYWINYSIDADDTWIGLTPGEIAAIVLGSLLLIVIIIAIILAACLCRGRQNKSHDLPVHPRTTTTSTRH